MRPDRKAAVVLAAIAASEGTWVVFEFAYNRSRFLRYLGFSAGRSGMVAAWLLALIVTVAFVAVALRLPSVRQNVFRPSWLKLLGIAVAVTAGILEEVMFRKWIMDSVAQHGGGVV